MDFRKKKNNKKENSITLSLIEHVYSQMHIAISASVFCALILYIGLYSHQNDNERLFIWGFIFLVSALLRFIIYFGYLKKRSKNNLKLWDNLHILSCFVGGASWGLAGVMLFPFADSSQQTLIILMLAGISSASVALSAAIPKAEIIFLSTSVLTFILSIIVFKSNAYYLFNITLTLYYFYTIFLTIKNYTLIKNSIILQYEKNRLLKKLQISNIELENISTHDPLTNIANRRLFYKNLNQAIKHAKNNALSLSVFYLDLDNFKQANDKYGHDAGDHILKNVIHRLSIYFRKDDILARLGGDEFTVIIEGTKNKEELESIAMKICKLIASPIQWKENVLNVSASVGISIYPSDADNAEKLLTIADQNMFYAKKHGGNQFSFTSND